MRPSFIAVAALVLVWAVACGFPSRCQAQQPGNHAGGVVYPAAMAQALEGIPQTAAPISFKHLPQWIRSLGFYLGICLAVAGLSFAEWRWLVARHNHLKALVLERTRELETEKAELIQAKAALVKLASHDFLTGVYSRGAIFDLLEQEVKRARRERTSFAVVLTDLDNFKRVNDSYGHLIGDAVLREFAQRVLSSLGPRDHVGRFGGEELLILVPGMRDESSARIARVHKEATEKPFVLGTLLLRVTSSFGVAWFPAPLNTVESLLSLADEALYAAKANGRNRVEVAERLSISPAGKSAEEAFR